MSKVVIDTSSFIRATLERDNTALNCLAFVLSNRQLIYTVEMAQELLVATYRVSIRKGKNPNFAFKMAATALIKAKPVETQTRFPWCSDPDDAMFVECAIDGQADFVISNDHSLTTIKEYVTDEHALELIRDIEFVTPEEFLKIHTDKEEETCLPEE
jgi:putative PIN family toxin of toxin-antitoxin system